MNVREAGVLAAGLVIVAASLWWVVLPHWRPPVGPGEVYGIDVSHHQGLIDWDAVAEDGIAFAYIKATEGGDWLDARWRRNWEQADRAGLARGAYHYFTLCRPGDQQANWFLEHAPPTPGALPPAVDIELAGNCAARPPEPEVVRELDAFLGKVEEAWGVEVLLYVGNSWEERYPVIERLDRPMWLQRFPLRPRADQLRIWQLHGFAEVAGIAGRTDLNIGPRPQPMGSPLRTDT